MVNSRQLHCLKPCLSLSLSSRVYEFVFSLLMSLSALSVLISLFVLLFPSCFPSISLPRLFAAHQSSVFSSCLSHTEAGHGPRKREKKTKPQTLNPEPKTLKQQNLFPLQQRSCSVEASFLLTHASLGLRD